jgi:hypothetical protein
MLSKIATIFILALCLSSCGAKVEKDEIKSYVLALKDGDAAYKSLVKRMIDDYNQNLGLLVLEYSDSIDTANCPVIITKGLEKRDGKVGWGQWFSQTERKGTIVSVPGTVATETVRYSLQVEFDEDFLVTNEKSSKNGLLSEDIRKLFAHEIGHGFQMQHAPEVKDVMYYDISGEKDFATYWPRVREFFQTPN